MFWSKKLFFRSSQFISLFSTYRKLLPIFIVPFIYVVHKTNTEKIAYNSGLPQTCLVVLCNICIIYETMVNGKMHNIHKEKMCKKPKLVYDMMMKRHEGKSNMAWINKNSTSFSSAFICITQSGFDLQCVSLLNVEW